MIRDDKMMELVAKEKEPITPFIHKIRSLYEDHGVSSVLVIGGSGDYFDVADCVVMLDSYQCHDVTARAKQISSSAATSSDQSHVASSSQPFGTIFSRCPVSDAYRPNNKVAVRTKGVISYGDIELEVGGLEQIVDVNQTNAVSFALQRISETAAGKTLARVLADIDVKIDREGLDALAPGHFHGGLARPRLFEIAGAANRLRKSGNMVQKK
jgi:predicted ABC-class ATPase